MPGDNGLLCLILDFSGIASRIFFPFRMTLTVGFSYLAFITLRHIPSTLVFFRSFNVNPCWILSKAFYASIEILWSLSLNQFAWSITFADLHMLRHPCISGKSPTWSWWIIFSICLYFFFQVSYWIGSNLCLPGIRDFTCFGALVLAWYWLHWRSLGVLLLF